MPSEIIEACCQLLIDKKLTIAFAESMTAGRLCSEFALVPDSGQILKGSLVCYHQDAKESLLKVPAKMIETYTAESLEVTQQMALGLTNHLLADIHVAITGLASPGGSESPEKPVGTIFIAGHIKDQSFNVIEHLSGTPEEIILQACDSVATLIAETVAKR